jgi:glycogen debranching enzyme
MDTYFTRIVSNATKEKVALANNGWIWAGNSLVNFASKHSKAYFLREVIPWMDAVKLRYGNGPEDSPWLWEYMGKYSEFMAQLYHVKFFFLLIFL